MVIDRILANLPDRRRPLLREPIQNLWNELESTHPTYVTEDSMSIMRFNDIERKLDPVVFDMAVNGNVLNCPVCIVLVPYTLLQIVGDYIAWVDSGTTTEYELWPESESAKEFAIHYLENRTKGPRISRNEIESALNAVDRFKQE